MFSEPRPKQEFCSMLLDQAELKLNCRQQIQMKKEPKQDLLKETKLLLSSLFLEKCSCDNIVQTRDI